MWAASYLNDFLSQDSVFTLGSSARFWYLKEEFVFLILLSQEYNLVTDY